MELSVEGFNIGRLKFTMILNNLLSLTNSHQLITARKRSLPRLCFYRCLSVHRGVYLPRYTPLGRYTPRQVHRPKAGTPPGRYTPQQQCMLAYGQQAGDTHPTAMHSCSLVITPQG